jgi:hypothetical protein
MKASHLLFGLTLFGVLAGNAMADKASFDKNHPRRAQVNGRLNNQNARINAKEANGTMTKAQGNQLKHNDRQIRGEERAMASQNGGHITKQEQKTLNQQENRNSQAIKNQ